MNFLKNLYESKEALYKFSKNIEKSSGKYADISDKIC